MASSEFGEDAEVDSDSEAFELSWRQEAGGSALLLEVGFKGMLENR